MYTLILSLYLTLTQVGNVVYIENNFPNMSRLAFRCDAISDKHYILLDIGRDSTTEDNYKLAYDNIYGTSINNDIYKPQTWDQNIIGIYIKIHKKDLKEEEVMKMVRYGISNYIQLKRRYHRMLKKGFYDRDSPSISRVEIERIIK